MTTYISKGYLALQRELHEAGEYGRKGDRWAKKVEELYNHYKCSSVLDFGCGRAKLSKALPHLSMRNYDPCIPKRAAAPEPADLVVSCDVLEHIEPDYIDNVLTHIRSLTKVAFFAVIGMEPAMKFLSDGRNAHVLLRPRDWWLDMFGKHKFSIDDVTEKGARNLIIVARPC